MVAIFFCFQKQKYLAKIRKIFHLVLHKGEMIYLKILEHIEGVRQAKGLTRQQMAELMGSGYSKESLDKIFQSKHCPRAETIALMLKVLNQPTFPPEWFRSKKWGEEE